MDFKKSIAIIGAGYSGIGAAIKLLDKGYKIYLIEKSEFIYWRTWKDLKVIEWIPV